MTTLRFIESDLEKWARFSNDYNPIHFDKNFAKKFGLDDVVVHGMLGINHIFRSVETNDADESLSIKCVLKKPLPVNSDIKLEKLNHKVRLVDNKSGNMLFMANVSCSDKWDNKKCYPELYEVGDINNKLYELMQLYPEKRIWILINSIVFSEYIASHGQFLSREIADWKKKYNHTNDGQFMVMHANHNVFLQQEIVNVVNHSYVGSLKYSIDKIELVESKNTVYALLRFDILVNNVHLMSIEIGLIAISK